MIVLAFLKDKTLVEAMEEVLLPSCNALVLPFVIQSLYPTGRTSFFVVLGFALCILLVEPHSQSLFAVLGFTFSI